MASVLSAPYFHSEEAAFALIEAHLWPHGPVCPHCGVLGENGRLNGKATRIGLRKCYACRGQFTVRIGTIFEDSRLPLRLWLQAIHLLCSSKKGFSTRQLQRILGVGMKTAWFLGHRIREAMKDGSLGPLGGEGQIVEADETYHGRTSEVRTAQADGRPYTSEKYARPKRAIIALVERGGRVRSFHVEKANKATVAGIVTRNVSRESRLHTDESHLYKGAEAHTATHETVNHGREEYARGDVTTNTIEGYFGIFKRGMKGIYQQCSEKHLHRYLAEFDFRYNNRSALGVEDQARTVNAIKGAKGKRLTYRTTSRRVSPQTVTLR
jgi:transposase-like protein